MGLIEQSRYLMRRELSSFAESVDPAEALRDHILALEHTRLQLEQWLLRLRQAEADQSRRRRHNSQRIAARELEIRAALAREADEAARRAIQGKRELIEIERELAAEGKTLAELIASVADDLDDLCQRAREAKTHRVQLLRAPGVRATVEESAAV